MLECQSVVSGKCLEVIGRKPVNEDPCGMPIYDKAVVESPPGVTQGEQRLGVAVLLQQDIIDCRKAILQIPERANVGADPLADVGNGPCFLDDAPQLRRDDVVDDGIDQPDSSSKPIEDRRLAHIGDRGDLLERRSEPLLPEHLNRRMPDPIDITAGIGTESGGTSGVGHDATSFRADE